MVKIVDKETLLKEKEAKRQAELEKAAEKEKKKAELAAAQAAKEAQKKIPPSEMFKQETDKYSQFDENVVTFSNNRNTLFIFLFFCRVFPHMMLKVKRLVKVNSKSYKNSSKTKRKNIKNI